MPIYGNASAAEPFQLSRDLPPEKRLELYEFEFENDENEVPSKKFKKRKPREKKKGTKFFENIGKSTLPPPPKPKKVPKKCVEEVTKRVLPKRGALKQILPAANIQASPATKNVKRQTKSAIKPTKDSSFLSGAVDSSTCCSDQSVVSNVSAAAVSAVNCVRKPSTRSTRSKVHSSSVAKCGALSKNPNDSVASNAPASALKQPLARKCVGKSTNRLTRSRVASSPSSKCASSTKNADQSVVSHAATNSLKLPNLVEKPIVCRTKSMEPSFNLSKRLSSTRVLDQSGLSNTTSNTMKQSSFDALFGPSDSLPDQNETSKPPSFNNSLLHQISINDFDVSVAESVKSRRSSSRQSPSLTTFKVPASVTVRTARNGSKKAKAPRCSSPKNAKHIESSSPNISKSLDRTLLFGATSPIKRQSNPQISLPQGDGESSLVNNFVDSNTNTFNSSLKSFGNDSCLIAGHHDDTYKSTGEEDLCQYFGFDEELEDEEPSCIPTENKVKVAVRKGPQVEKVKPQEFERPPVDEVLSLLKSSVPVDSDSPENFPEPFCLSSNIWSPVKSLVYRDTEEDAEMPQISKRSRPRTKPVFDDSETNGLDLKKRQKTDNLASVPEFETHIEGVSHEEEDDHNPSSSKNALTHARKGRTKAKTGDDKKQEIKPDQPLDEEKKMNVYKVSKRTKGVNKQTKEKKEEGNKRELDEFEALAASLNSQFAAIESFNLAVE